VCFGDSRFSDILMKAIADAVHLLSAPERSTKYGIVESCLEACLLTFWVMADVDKRIRSVELVDAHHDVNLWMSSFFQVCRYLFKQERFVFAIADVFHLDVSFLCLYLSLCSFEVTHRSKDLLHMF